mgnify:CR=1 FL=1
MSSCMVAFGANIPGPSGGPLETVKRAIKELNNFNIFKINQSKIYISKSFPDKSKPEYINGCLHLECNFDPYELLKRLKKIEEIVGRSRAMRWDSRVCDFDILSYENRVIPNVKTFKYWHALSLERQILEIPNTLVLPHPRLQDRAFVLKPLADLAPNWTHPILNLKPMEMLNALPKTERLSVKASTINF